MNEAQAVLLDLKETPELRRNELKRRDFQDLGVLIYQFAGSPKPEDAVDAAMRCSSAHWQQLGDKEQEWKTLVERLLKPEPSPGGDDLAGAREQWLGDLQPLRTPFTIVIRPLSVDIQPHFRRDELAPAETPAEPPVEVDYQGEMERMLGEGDHLAALQQLQQVPAEFEPRERVVAWADLIADGAADELGNHPDFLDGLETLAKQGCHRAALRLGQWLAKRQPAEALRWLDAAAKAGLTESYLFIADIYEHGGADVPADPAKALVFYQRSLDHHDSRDWDAVYRMAAVILREQTLAAWLPQAIQLLSLCHANGHYRSSDLLAQCHANGLGVESDEKRAFQLFADAWNRSKKSNENFYTASNNLGVCFAIGFGVRKDSAMARHYFKQGEIAGHDASKRNLQALQQCE